MGYGAILGQTSSGKRVCRFTVGTSTSGWTSADCDYLCDGTADQVEINAAIQALPSTGGDVVILDGTYNIAATIAMNKANVKLSGNGAATVLKRMWNSSTYEGVINITATNGGCCVENLQIDGNNATYTSNFSRGIYLSNSDNNTITGNTCNNNSYYGIYLSNSNNNTITGNTCNNNNRYSISLSDSSNNNTITGNTCIRRTGQSSDYTSLQYTIRLDGTENNYNLIAYNNIMGKNYVSDGGTGNTFNGNKYN